MYNVNLTDSYNFSSFRPPESHVPGEQLVVVLDSPRGVLRLDPRRPSVELLVYVPVVPVLQQEVAVENIVSWCWTI